MRTLSLNTHYVVLFRNYRDQLQVEVLGRQVIPRQIDYFREFYLKATSERYGYMLVDVSPHAPQLNIIDRSTQLLSLRSQILPGQDNIVYEPNDTLWPCYCCQEYVSFIDTTQGTSWRVPHAEQEMLTLPEHLISSLVFIVVHVVLSFVSPYFIL